MNQITGSGAKKYYGSKTFKNNSDADVNAAFNFFFNTLMPLAANRLPGLQQACFTNVRNEMCNLFFPACYQDKPQKSCKSTCSNALKDCGPLQGFLPTLKKGGTFRIFVDMLTGQLNNTAKEILDLIIDNLSCDTNNFSANEKKCSKLMINR